MRGTFIAAAAVGALLPLGTAQAQGPFDWTGFYAGIHGGLINGQVSIDGGMVTGDVSGPAFGVLAGRNFMAPAGQPYLWGVEGDFGWINAAGEGGGGSSDDGCADYYYDLNWDAHLRARWGLPGGAVMPFVAAGLAVANLDVSECREPSGGVFVGGTVGGGIDFKLAPSVVGRGEFLYDFYGKKDYDEFSASLHAWTIRAALMWMLP